MSPSNIVALPSVIARGGQLTVTVDNCPSGGTIDARTPSQGTGLTPVNGGNQTARGTATVNSNARPGSHSITVICDGRTLTNPAAFTVIGGVRGGLGGSSSTGATPTDMAIGGGLVAAAVVGGGVFWMRRRSERQHLTGRASDAGLTSLPSEHRLSETPDRTCTAFAPAPCQGSGAKACASGVRSGPPSSSVRRREKWYAAPSDPAMSAAPRPISLRSNPAKLPPSPACTPRCGWHAAWGGVDGRPPAMVRPRVPAQTSPQSNVTSYTAPGLASQSTVGRGRGAGPCADGDVSKTAEETVASP